MNARSLKAAFLATTVLSFGATEAAAQIEEVVVTARRREESLQEVPLTVTAFTAQSIERQGIRGIEQVANLTPGLNFDKGFAPQDTRPNIRGLPTTRGRPPIGILLDGIDISSESIGTAGGSSLMNLKLIDVERIEVVKGPQSALYGRVAFGGAINYVSKKPNTGMVEANVSADIATHELFEVRGAVNVPVVQDRLAVRINGLYSSFDGFYKNTVTDNTIGGWKTKGIAGAFRFTPNDAIDATLRLSYSDEKSEPRPSYFFGGASSGQTRALPSNAVGLRLGVPPGGAPLPATIPYPNPGEAKARDRVQLSADPFTNRDFEGGRVKPFIASVVGDVDLGFATLSSWTGYTFAKILSRTDADFFGLPATAVTIPSPGTAEPLNAFQISDFETKATQVSQELRLGNLEAETFRWAIGGLYWKEDYESYNRSIFINGLTRLAPAGWSAAREIQLRGRPPGELNARYTEHYSAYAMGAVDITDQIELAVEGRYNHEKFTYVFGRTLTLPIAGTTLLPYTFTGSVFRPNASTNFFAPRASLKYQLNDDINFYASVSKGVKPAGFLNVAVVFDPADAFYRPEKLWNYEAGFKSTWMDNRVRFNGAVFHMVYSNRITQLLVPDARSPQGSITKTVNQGQAKVTGFELDGGVEVTEGLSVTAAYTYLNARFTESEVPNVAALGVAQAGNCRVGTVGAQVVCFSNTNGNRLEQSAKHSFTGSISYTMPLSNDWNLFTAADFQHRSKRFIDPGNTVFTPAYWNVDARVGVDNETYSVQAYVNNLFDDRKVRSMQSYGDPFLVPPFAPPVLAYTTYATDKRQFGLRVGAKF